MIKSIREYAVINLSGGMDSSTLLLHLIDKGITVEALSFDYGQKHKLELERAKELIDYLQIKGNYVRHTLIKLEGLKHLLNSSLIEGGNDVPEGHYAHSNMKQTVVPNRNKIFSSISQAVALSLSIKYSAKCTVALGIHAGDHTIYKDCRQEFRDVDFEAFKAGNWNTENVNMYTPYLQYTKYDILVDGVRCCERLGLDFDEVYSRTNTSYKPIFIGNNIPSGNESFGGKWYSDYKSASSVERIEAFLKLGRRDPVQYADETGPVTWTKVVDHVMNIINNKED